MTLAFKDANSKVLDVVSVANVDTEGRVGRHFGRDFKLKVDRNLEPEFWPRYQSRSLFKILKET